MKDIKEKKRLRISEYAKADKDAKYFEVCKGIWSLKADICLPCATQNEIGIEEAKMIVDEAKTNANSIVHEALVDAEKIKHTNMILEKNVKVYKERVKNLLEAELEIVEDLDKVELSEV